MKKRLLAVILTIVLIIGAIPVMAYTEDPAESEEMAVMELFAGEEMPAAEEKSDDILVDTQFDGEPALPPEPVTGFEFDEEAPDEVPEETETRSEDILPEEVPADAPDAQTALEETSAEMENAADTIVVEYDGYQPPAGSKASNKAPTLLQAAFWVAAQAIQAAFQTEDTAAGYYELYLVTPDDNKVPGSMGELLIRNIQYYIWGIQSFGTPFGSGPDPRASGNLDTGVVIVSDTIYTGQNPELAVGDEVYIVIQSEGIPQGDQYGSEYSDPVKMVIQEGVTEVKGKEPTVECPKSSNKKHKWGPYEVTSDAHSRVCQYCKAVDEGPHTYDDQWTRGGTEHSRICNVCKKYQDKQPHTADRYEVESKKTCVRDAMVKWYCDTCGWSWYMTEAEMATVNKDEFIHEGHKFEGQPYSNDGPETVSAENAGKHYRSCSECGTAEDPKVPHAWGERTVTKGECMNPDKPRIEEAVCTAPGCGAQLRIVTPITEHDLERREDLDEKPTCLDYGFDRYQCRNCGEIVSDAVAPLGHDKSNVIDSLEPTCQTDGYIVYECPRCELQFREDLPKLSPTGDHVMVRHDLRVATCQQTGIYYMKCRYCDYQEDNEYVPRTGHNTVQKDVISRRKSTEKVGVKGTDLRITVHEITTTCINPGCTFTAKDTLTVVTSFARNKYDIIRNNNAEITDIKNGVHVMGQLYRNSEVEFANKVLQEYNQKLGAIKAEYEVTEGSVIVTFTDSFLATVEDGDYEVIIRNGNQYWPMIMTFTNHELTGLADMDIADAPEMSDAEFDEMQAQYEQENGAPMAGYFCLLQPVIVPQNGGQSDENGNIVVTKMDGDYPFDCLIAGDRTLVAGQDYELDGDTVTIPADLAETTDILFHYDEIGYDGAPLPIDPVLRSGK